MKKICPSTSETEKEVIEIPDVKPEPENIPSTTSLDVTSEITELIDTLNALGKSRKYIQGFTVQVYNGKNREEAFKAKERVYSLNLGFEPEVVYVQPNFKVKIGQYIERIEARRTQNKLATEFTNAIVIPDRIYFE